MKLEQPLASYNGKPEIDDGHTKIANELLDAIISHDFSKRQLKILLLIMRKTYGWNKAEDDISRSQFVESTGLLNPHITTSLQELQSMNVLIVTPGKHAKCYKINKYYSQWRVTKTVIITETVTVTETVIVTETVKNSYQNGNNPLPKQYPQKTTPKDTSKDNINCALKETCLEALNFLNEKVGRSYKPVRANLDLIKARLKEGYTKDEILHVITIKSSQWLTDVAMEKYLRPATLFNASKFSQYVAETHVIKNQEPAPSWKKNLL